ncbi:hypothetical protein [Advenella kashmirensis]|nr:hypothetical protein [Advenella kashmirensis]
MKFSLTPMALALAVLPATVMAQTSTPVSPDTPVTRLETIIATPARANQALGDVYGDVSVITSETLRNAGATSLTELLARQPQIQTYQLGGPQTLSGCSCVAQAPSRRW